MIQSLTDDGLQQQQLLANKSRTAGKPRVSVVFVLSENHVVSPDRVLTQLEQHVEREVDVLVACAGQPANLSSLQRVIGSAQFLLAPAGTDTEDLRELAMARATGDVITLLNGTHLDEGAETQRRLAQTS